MAKKKTPVIKIDQRTESVGGGLPFIQEEQILPPAAPSIEGPTNLIFVNQGIIRSTQAPLAFVSISWDHVLRVSPDYYSVEWSESSSFTDSLTSRAYGTSAVVQNLKVEKTYYFRVKAVLGGIFSAYSNTLSVTTTSDPTLPPNVTGFAGSYIKSDLVLTWVKPVSDEVYKDLKILIYDEFHSILYGTFFSGSQQFTWTAEQNLVATSNVGAKVVQVDIFSRSWSNVLSASPINITVTAPAIPTPTPVSNWDGDTPQGIADEDLIISGLSYAEADSYEITLDGFFYKTKEPTLTYRYDRNVQDHIITLASGDPQLSYIVQGRTKINKASPAASGTWTNAAPSGALLTLATTVGFSQIAAQVTTSKIIQDFDHYEWTLGIVSGPITQQFTSTTPDVIMLTSGSGTYQVKVRAFDKFNQGSGQIVSSNLIIDSLTISELRAETRYIDNLGNTSPALDILKDDSTAVGQTYPIIASGQYNWIEAQRPTLDRYKTTTLVTSFSGGSIILTYLTYNDGTTNTFYSGPISTGTSGQKILTKYTSESTAQTNAFRLDLLGVTRIDLPNLQEARKIRVNFSNYVNTISVREYYPRRLVQSDDIEAETIKGINIAASTITADKINVLQLNAITANIGKLTITDGFGGTNAWLYQGTGTGDSPTTGIKLYNSGGIGRLVGYNAAVEQVVIDTDGKMKAGAGAVTLDSTGIKLTADNSASDATTNNIRWFDGSSNQVSSINTNIFGNLNTLTINATTNGPRHSKIYLHSYGTSNNNAQVIMAGSYTGIPSTIRILAEQNEVFITKSAGWFEVYNASSTVVFSVDNSGNVGIAGQAWPTTLRTDGNAAFGDSVQSNVRLYSKGVDSGSGNYGLVVNNSGSANMFLVRNDGYVSTFGPTQVNATLPNSVLYVRETNAAGHSLALFTGEPGIAYNTGVLGYNWFPTGGGTTGRQETGTGGSYIRFGENGMNFHNVTSGGTDNIYIDVSTQSVKMPGKLRIGDSTAATLVLEIATDSAGKPTTNTWSIISDNKTKKDIKPFEHGLTDLKLFPKPVFYKYNGEYGTPNDGQENVGYIAQDVNTVAPKMIQKVMKKKNEESEIEDEVLYLQLHAMQMMFHNAILELDTRLEILEKK